MQEEEKTFTKGRQHMVGREHRTLDTKTSGRKKHKAPCIKKNTQTKLRKELPVWHIPGKVCVDPTLM